MWRHRLLAALAACGLAAACMSNTRADGGTKGPRAGPAGVAPGSVYDEPGGGGEQPGLDDVRPGAGGGTGTVRDPELRDPDTSRDDTRGTGATGTGTDTTAPAPVPAPPTTPAPGGADPSGMGGDGGGDLTPTRIIQRV